MADSLNSSEDTDEPQLRRVYSVLDVGPFDRVIEIGEELSQHGNWAMIAAVSVVQERGVWGDHIELIFCWEDIGEFTIDSVDFGSELF